ncbi:hypothetical protein ACVQ92_05020 [Staphylococcus aureus]
MGKLNDLKKKVGGFIVKENTQYKPSPSKCKSLKIAPCNQSADVEMM